MNNNTDMVIKVNSQKRYTKLYTIYSVASPKFTELSPSNFGIVVATWYSIYYMQAWMHDNHFDFKS